MLLLVGQNRALGAIWWIKPGLQLTVGRKDTPLLVSGDKSVSRSHAMVEADPKDSSRVSVTDYGSKFGVHVNGEQCPANSRHPVNVGDTVTFGGQGSTFELRQCPVSICMANLHSGMDVEDCTHLLALELEVTRKLVLGLVLGRNIISSGYLGQLKLLPPSFDIPDPTAEKIELFIGGLQFLPAPQPPDALQDSPIDLAGVGWLPDLQRQRLFQSKLFAFSDSAQLDRYRAVIEASQGSCTLLSEAVAWEQTRSLSKRKWQAQAKALANALMSRNSDKEACLILPPAPVEGNASGKYSVTALINEMARLLSLRSISETEISLAVLFVSCDEHTNPAVCGTEEAANDPGSKPTSSVPDAPGDDTSLSTQTDPDTSKDLATTPEEESQQKTIELPASGDTGAVADDPYEMQPAPESLSAIVSLLRPKPPMPPVNCDNTSRGPNFKRFKKTAHLYQQEV
ncbi:hypothetical protein GGF46_004958 [Coemansia sp. RSA 552]|nr:hypothetical protein GGF46_004958 [Coemansia sp. RSA 552]